MKKEANEVLMEAGEDDGEDSYDQEHDQWSIAPSVLKDAFDK